MRLVSLLQRAIYGVVLVGTGLVVSACGREEPGHGTQDLKLVVDVHSVWNETNARSTCLVSDANELEMKEAQISVNLPGTAKVLWQSSAENEQTSLPFAPPYLGIRVTRGKQSIVCQAEGPAPHRLIRPASGTRHAQDQALRLSWEVDDGRRADNVQVYAWPEQRLLAVFDRDQGYGELPGKTLSRGVQTLRVTRTRTLVPEGALASSSVTIRYSADVSLIVY